MSKQDVVSIDVYHFGPVLESLQGNRRWVIQNYSATINNYPQWNITSRVSRLRIHSWYVIVDAQVPVHLQLQLPFMWLHLLYTRSGTGWDEAAHAHVGIAENNQSRPRVASLEDYQEHKPDEAVNLATNRSIAKNAKRYASRSSRSTRLSWFGPKI